MPSVAGLLRYTNGLIEICFDISSSSGLTFKLELSPLALAASANPNLWERYSSRTNNLSETYNHKINGQVISSKSNVFKVLDVLQKQEALTSVTFERVNLGKVKKKIYKCSTSKGCIDRLAKAKIQE